MSRGPIRYSSRYSSPSHFRQARTSSNGWWRVRAGWLRPPLACSWSRCWWHSEIGTFMSSSTSSSDIADPVAWGRWLAAFLGALALGAAVVLAFVLAVEPYDSGRFGILGIRGVDDASPRTANASRARDPQFDSAVIGNSTGQLIKPAELSGLTGKRFVQLTVPGTGPREQLAIMDFFVRQHPQVGAIVIVTDASWCQRDPALRMQHPFPFWLYGESTL